MPFAGCRHAQNRTRGVISAKLLAVAVIGGAAALAPVGTAFAATSHGGQYGPPPVTTPAPPGGFTTVLTTETIGEEGGTISLELPGDDLSIHIPDGAFTEDVQITVTEPDLANIPAPPGTTVVTGAGITVTLDGTTFPGTFLKPITADFFSSHITAASEVTVWNGSAFVTDPSSTSTAGSASVSFDSDPDFAVVTPTAAAAAPVPSATAPVTGVPVLGEGLLAGVLVLGGAAAVAVSRRRRARPVAAQE
jgi:hypothetical protein